MPTPWDSLYEWAFVSYSPQFVTRRTSLHEFRFFLLVEVIRWGHIQLYKVLGEMRFPQVYLEGGLTFILRVCIYLIVHLLLHLIRLGRCFSSSTFYLFIYKLVIFYWHIIIKKIIMETLEALQYHPCTIHGPIPKVFT